jgi:hypothetical protein
MVRGCSSSCGSAIIVSIKNPEPLDNTELAQPASIVLFSVQSTSSVAGRLGSRLQITGRAPFESPARRSQFCVMRRLGKGRNWRQPIESSGCGWGGSRADGDLAWPSSTRAQSASRAAMASVSPITGVRRPNCQATTPGSG